MKRGALILGILLFGAGSLQAQRRCGIENEKAKMIAKDPTWAARFAAQKDALQPMADDYKRRQSASRTTGGSSVPTIPVVFHIIVSPSELAAMGGLSGVQQRIDSQIVVLNRDFNRQNLDSTGIPSGWKPLYGNVGIQFGLAHTSPTGAATPGYEILVSGAAFNDSVNGDYPAAKYSSLGGLSAWDNTKYINVWCIDFSDEPGLLGITTPNSFTTGFDAIPNAEMGICINYLSLGKRASPSDDYIPSGWADDYYDQGRTLTHEMGHFFEIWHTWGDDGGACPWSPGGADDGLEDTPPEGAAHFYNWPDTIPGGTYYDNCKLDGATNTQPYGIASLDYLNYTDDVAMHMFTVDQAAAMASMISATGGGTGATGYGTIGESYSLTQNPALLQYPAGTGVVQTQSNTELNIYPNPTSGVINIAITQAAGALQSISVANMLGQEVKNINTTGNQAEFYSIDLSAMSKGMYFVRCNFATGTVTRKILLQ